LPTLRQALYFPRRRDTCGLGENDRGVAMARESDLTGAALGGFDRSFLVTMIRDFFLILLLVTVAEYALKAAMVVYDFKARGQAQARDVAEEVAGHVRQIMLNEGGPVAARTLYPILQENFSDLGYVIEIAPSAVTIASIEQSFGFTPRGMMVAAWPEGRHNSATVEIRAEAFCQTCHVAAEIGDVLGAVTVRNYLSREIDAWTKGLQITSVLAVGKIVLHSVLLFLLLRSRMAPLMQLRAMVGGLSRAFGSLDARADVRSPDEFGGLARDLNLFLDRISRVVAELDAVLHRVVAVNDDILRIQSDMRDRIDGFVGGLHKLERQAMLNARREPLLSPEWFDAMGAAVERLRAALPEGAEDPAAVLERLRAVIDTAERQIATNMALFEELARLGEESGRFQHALADMARLEERMRGVIDTGAALVARLQPGGAGGSGRG